MNFKERFAEWRKKRGGAKVNKAGTYPPGCSIFVGDETTDRFGRRMSPITIIPQRNDGGTAPPWRWKQIASDDGVAGPIRIEVYQLKENPKKRGG